jgi:CBS domain-containing protein
LATVLSYVTATRIAVYVGRAMAVLFAVGGMFGGGIFLLFIAFFVYVGGGAEREAVEHRAILRKVPVTRALRSPAVTLYTSETIGRAADLGMQNYQADFPVRDLGGSFVGVLTRSTLVKALREGGREVRVVDAMTPLRAIPVCTLGDDLSVAWERMMQSRGRVVVVMDDGQLLGLVTLDSVSEVMQIIGAANSRHAGQDKDQRSGRHWDEGQRNSSQWIDGQQIDDRQRNDRSSSML